MKQKNLLCELIVCLMLSISITSLAQTSKIAIISLADTTIVHQHVGVTIIGNFTDTLHLDIAVKQYVEEQLKKYLSGKYSVTVINDLPDSISSSQNDIYSKWGGLKKEVKNWLVAMKNQYDFVIFIKNISIPHEMNLLIPDNTSGFYTRGKYAAFYTTISFVPYRTSNAQKIEYYELGGNLMTQIKNFDLPEDKKTFTPDMLITLKDGIIKHLGSRVEYYLAKTYLVPQDQIDEIKSNKQ